MMSQVDPWWLNSLLPLLYFQWKAYMVQSGPVWNKGLAFQCFIKLAVTLFSLFPFSEHKDTFLFKRMAKPMKVKSGLLEVFKMKPSSSSFSALRQRQQRQQWQWVDCLRRTLTFITSWYHILFLIFSNKLPSHIISYDNGLRLFVLLSLSLSVFLFLIPSPLSLNVSQSLNLTFSVSLPFSSPAAVVS